MTVRNKISNKKKLILEQLEKIPVVSVVCERVDVGRTTYYTWRKEDRDFAEKADIALERSTNLINDLAESQLISAIKDQNLTAIIFWLKYRHKAFSSKLEVIGSINHTSSEISEEYKELINEALRLALPESKENQDETNN